MALASAFAAALISLALMFQLIRFAPRVIDAGRASGKAKREGRRAQKNDFGWLLPARIKRTR
jgi:hypothetical protein